MALSVAIAAAASMPAPLHAGTVSSVQSAARPLGLDVVGLVQEFGSDARAADFQQRMLPQFQQFVKANLGESKAVADVASISLNPADLRLTTDADVRVYFVGEGAGYHNSLGFFTSSYDPSQGITATDAQLILPDASSAQSSLRSGTFGVRSTLEPLLAGDFVDLGTLSAGTQINPFVIADGAYGGTRVYTPDPSQNADGIQHFVSMAMVGMVDSPYILIGIEDLYGGGDKDYNDLVFVLDIGTANVAQLVSASVPLPTPLVALCGPCAFGIVWLLKHRRGSVLALFRGRDGWALSSRRQTRAC